MEFDPLLDSVNISLTRLPFWSAGGVRPSFGLRQYWSSGVVFFGQPGEAALLGLRRFRHRAWDGHDGLHGLGSLLYAGGTGQGVNRGTTSR
eukprot:scaffold3146_cov98-Isochrysis_galbana.AAC.10